MPIPHAILTDPLHPTLQGELIYRRSEYSFDFEPMSRSGVRRRTGDFGTTSVLIGTLQIEIGIETGTFLYVWGYYPETAWKRHKLPNPTTQPGKVSISFEEPPELSVSIGLVEFNEWTTAYDPRTGWLCVGDPAPNPTAQLVEFATNTIAVIYEVQLRALWLRPKMQ
jgi:hypothetical protein